ncbi:T9SS outer membrane translocon Sov/SprA [Flavobacterium orientale]|uniref:Cell surface protein SprA n=1 Tax=Flavobacterium orientale TaxID=1756020 RepID=A0A917DGI1_9FLAO|nr:cell surface protein SprA [Flavobacterium orientale]GGD33742.1 cell surface protein SprA [Flavobacterium orientale]
MKKVTTNRLRIVKRIILLLLVFCSGFYGFSQEDEDTQTPQDSTGFSIGKILLNNPNSILAAYTYDPITDRYIYNNTIGEYNITYPLILTPKEYHDLVQKEAMRNYFKQKLDAIEGKKAGSEAAQKDLLPRYYVNSGFFETIFGSNTIDVQPRGSVEMDLGVRYTKQDNPSFSPRNRTNTTFDFDQRISMSLTGKVGTRLAVNANYDTQSTFAFQNLIKLEYTPDEDAILQKLEVGNVSMPLNNTLIRGAQSLFGAKAQFQFGKTTITGIFSEQKSQTRSVTAQGGGTLQDFELFALDYDADRHFFLSQYFRSRYDVSLRNYPFIDSRVQITRIEVWITNRQNRVTPGQEGNNLRNIVALQDLGEARLLGIPDNQVVGLDPAVVFDPTVLANTPSRNSNNFFDPRLIGDPQGLLKPEIREIVTTDFGFNLPPTTVSEGRDYSKLENARKLTSNEFTYHPQLGYISLQQRLTNDEVLAVAYQYTIGDEVYQVGEFGNDGVESTVVDPDGVPSTQSLVLKLLKSNLTNVNQPIWNLMMKNIYQIQGAFQLSQDDFRFNILYTDPSPLNYITPVPGSDFPPSPTPGNEVAETPLLKVFNLDRLNYNNDPQVGGDGFFDFIPGLTVDTQNGRIIFTTVEPFGRTLFNKLTDGAQDYDFPSTYNTNQNKYVFQNMYRSTQAAALQDSDKNKFQLKGRYKSTGGDGIAIGGFNIPQGSVVVTAGGRVLVEGVDYTVNYQLGRVRILDPSLSSTPIEVSVENNAVFGQQTRRFFGVNVEHQISENFQVGGTFLRMTERPFTQKSTFGQESVNNTIYGVNANYSSELPFLTRVANKLPFVDTDVPSMLSLRGEIAFLKPDSPSADNFNGEATLYVDDFEGSQTTIDMRSPFAWSLASVPARNTASTYNFLENSEIPLEYGFKRAKLSWYSIDPIFYTSQRPSAISDADLATNKTRRVFINELFPVTDIVQGQTTVINTLDLTYYPRERGPYNFNTAANGTNNLPNPETNFGGIMRAINSTNFEQGNVEYIQFWILDPYVGAGAVDISNQGKIYFNLGEISEDVLKDGRKMYENGLPNAGSSQPTIPTIWGKVPASQSLIYAFDADGGNRASQDLGLNGLTDDEEAAQFPAFAGLPDPAGDNYQFYLNTQGDIIERYKEYNGLQGNSPVTVTDNNRGNTTLPDVEDINRDNTMNTINAYYEYSIDVRPGMQVGENYITDIVETTPVIPGPGNQTTDARWIQFKIPVTQPENIIGNISDFRSIRFMRMFLTEFTEEVTLRFGVLELVRGEWRRFERSLDPNETTEVNDDDDTALDVLSVNILENSNRQPINYVLPPGVEREQLYNQNTVVNQNEQSLSLRISKKTPSEPGLGGLEPGDARAVFKNIEMDFRQFNKLRMFLHAEALPTEGNDANGLKDDEMIAFVRFGNDFTENFYQVEIPLKVTQHFSVSPEDIWPKENEMELTMALLTKLKILNINGTAPTPDAFGISFVDETELDPSMANKETAKLRLGIKGNPNFGLVRTIMIGLKNGTTNQEVHSMERDIRGEVWFNELRVSDMNNQGGMAAILNMDSNMADLISVSAVGRMSTIGFGALEQGANERSREDMKQYDIVTNVNFGKFLPNKWGLNLPFNYAIGEQIITPEYDPFNQDIRLEQLLDVTPDAAERENIRSRAIDYTKRKSINFIGVRKDRGPEQKPRVYDVENLTLSHSFNQVERHDFEIEDYIDKQTRTGVDYAYTFQNKPIEPLKNNAFMKKSQYWKLLSDFNFNYLPSSINFSSNILRQYNRQQFRQVEVAGIPLDALYRRNYLFNYQYGFNFNLTKSVKINYTASTSNIVRNYMDEENVPDNTNTIWDDYWSIGTPNQHNQQLVLNYELPLNKLPFLSFLKSTYSYTGTYNWQRASLALGTYVAEDGISYNLGNTIQNSGSHRLNATLNMDMFYKYIGLTKGPKKPAQTPRPAPPKPGEKIVSTRQPVAQESNVFLDGLIGFVTSVKNIQANYTHNTGAMLPGYLPTIGFFGSSRPSLAFVMGAQDEVRYEAAKNGWLTNYPDFNQSFTQVVNKQLNLTAKVDLFPDFTIDLVADRNYMENFSEQYDVTDGVYNSRSPYTFGNFSISTSMIKTSFSSSDENGSAPFDEFRQNRLEIANRLAVQRGIDISDPSNLDAEGYPIGYGKNNQAVLIPAFLSAYTGKDAGDVSLTPFRNVPIPNWTVKYSGLMRYQFFKDKFRRFSLQHGYRASYTINSFRSNFEYDLNPNTIDPVSGNYYNQTLIGNINLVEQFNPLIRVDMEMKNSFKILAEMKKDRALSLSFDNNLLTEQRGVEYIIGLGYRIKDVIFSSTLADNPTGVIKSDINIRTDLSFRDNTTIVRYLDYDNNQLAGGQNLWSAKLTADYAFSKELTVIFYYDHMFSKAVISTSFPMTNIRTGFTLRYNFGN